MERQELLSAFDVVRRTTERICQPLVTEDYVIQSMPDVSPPKWHLAHTTWFFERVVLQQFSKNYQPYNEQYYFLFNSYYQSFGERWSRDVRGTLSRPTVKDVFEYRAAINERTRSFIRSVGHEEYEQIAALVELGLHHEQQHQELLVTDIKHILASNPLRPIYKSNSSHQSRTKSIVGPAKFIGIQGGMFEMGATKDGFAWDNEFPRHKAFVNDFGLMDRLVTCGEFLEFMNDGGYENPLLWLSDGWDVVTRERWNAPMYWEKVDDEWQITTLSGTRPIDPNEPVSHVSYYEASAYARWADKRLPMEAEWERAATSVKTAASCGNFLETENYHPVPLGHAPGVDPDGLSQMFGDVWEWTSSSYLPYPGYKQEKGPLGEYNGKFMINQMVLRGGSCATPRTHIRSTYRNFFQCDKRWQFTGFRLASDTI
jgi:ergothioneine biosynthesis protein EgtB